MALPMPLCLLFLDRLYYIRCGKNTSLHVQLAEAELKGCTIFSADHALCFPLSRGQGASRSTLG